MEDKDKVIYEEMRENLVDINIQRQRRKRKILKMGRRF